LQAASLCDGSVPFDAMQSFSGAPPGDEQVIFLYLDEGDVAQVAVEEVKLSRWRLLKVGKPGLDGGVLCDFGGDSGDPGIAVWEVCGIRGAMQGEAAIAEEVACFDCIFHTAHPQFPGSELKLCTRDAGRAVGAQSGEKRMAMGVEPGANRLCQGGTFELELAP
jgi:hypothetical protein